MKKILLYLPLFFATLFTTQVMAQSVDVTKKSCCAKDKTTACTKTASKEKTKIACCSSKGTAKADAKTSGCSPSSCRGAKTKFGEAKVITSLRDNVIALKASMEKSTDITFAPTDFDIHGIVGDNDDESLEILVKHVQQAEDAIAAKMQIDMDEFALPEGKAKQVAYLNERIAQLQAAL